MCLMSLVASCYLISWKGLEHVNTYKVALLNNNNNNDNNTNAEGANGLRRPIKNEIGAIFIWCQQETIFFAVNGNEPLKA